MNDRLQRNTYQRRSILEANANNWFDHGHIFLSIVGIHQSSRIHRVPAWTAMLDSYRCNRPDVIIRMSSSCRELCLGARFLRYYNEWNANPTPPDLQLYIWSDVERFGQIWDASQVPERSQRLNACSRPTLVVRENACANRERQPDRPLSHHYRSMTPVLGLNSDQVYG